MPALRTFVCVLLSSSVVLAAPKSGDRAPAVRPTVEERDPEAKAREDKERDAWNEATNAAYQATKALEFKAAAAAMQAFADVAWPEGRHTAQRLVDARAAVALHERRAKWLDEVGKSAKSTGALARSLLVEAPTLPPTDPNVVELVASYRALEPAFDALLKRKVQVLIEPGEGHAPTSLVTAMSKAVDALKALGFDATENKAPDRILLVLEAKSEGNVGDLLGMPNAGIAMKSVIATLRGQWKGADGRVVLDGLSVKRAAMHINESTGAAQGATRAAELLPATVIDVFVRAQP